MVKAIQTRSRVSKFSLMANLLILTGLLFTLSFQASAALKITASVNQNPIVQGSSFILEIRANESISASDWDNSALLADFVVGRTSINSQSYNINGKSSHITSLTTVLMARNIGAYTIPAFTIDGATTQPIKINVISSATASSRGLNNRNIELKVNISEKNIYVGQQFIYTTTLYFAQNTKMQSGNLIEPTVVDGVVKQIGKDENASQVVDGRRFETITRQYSITINTAGKTTISPSQFEGQVSTAKRGYRFGPITPVIIQADTLDVNIQAQPKDYKGEWLVSDFVQLNEELQPSQENYQQGEPITRTITLTVANVDKSALPDLAISWPQTVKIYPDKPQLTDFAQQGHYFSQQVLSFAIIPNQLGELTLPEISVPWFNSKTQQQEWATLPAKTVTILPSENNIANQNDQTPLLTSNDSNQENIQTLSTAPTESPLWRWLTFIFAGLWILTCVAWFILRKRRHKAPSPEITVAAKTDNIWPQLQTALKNNDANQSSQLLHLWFKQCWPEIKNPQLTSLPMSKECQQACQALFTFTYGNNAEITNWNGQVLLAQLTKLKGSKNTITKKQQPEIKTELNP
ncbi:BatD family protein [Moritella viscosa]|uniref:BatD protein n=2 Tax=Moritella viscosa TaxID=80854 RepID=A0ABY1H955_9GAMM|nr:BatD family protein [Moritella viscosa]SGY85963.1 BatD protein [Moritella viscosa]SGY89272.1 BatD protein [Moritella viscosa]SHO24868.1 BatD protein [Moritella viscosa]